MEGFQIKKARNRGPIFETKKEELYCENHHISCVSDKSGELA